MIIKKLVKKDLYGLYKTGLHEFNGELWFTMKFLEETIKTPGYYYGAFERNKLIGGILVRKFDMPKLWIFFLIIDKNFRRKSVGSKLIKIIEKNSSKEFPLIFVDIDENNYSAKKFYEKNGFVKQAKINDWFGINNEGTIYSKKVIS